MGGSWGENGYTHVNSWVPSLFTWNYPNTNQLYSSIKWKVRNTVKIYLQFFQLHVIKTAIHPKPTKTPNEPWKVTTKGNPEWAPKRSEDPFSHLILETQSLEHLRSTAWYSQTVTVTPSSLLSSHRFQGELTFWSSVTISRVTTAWSCPFCPDSSSPSKCPQPSPTRTPNHHPQTHCHQTSRSRPVI